MSKLPNGWIETSLGCVMKIYSGKTRPKNKGVFPVYGGNGILNYADKYNQENKTIIIGRVGAYCGNIFAEEQNFWLSDNALGVKNKTNSDIKFLYYKLINMKLNNYAIGGAQPLLTQTILKELKISIPLLPEQKVIADILSSFDEKIKLLREQNETLETIAQTIFKELFVNFKNEKPIPISKLIEFNPIEKIDRKKEYLFFDMKTLSTNSMATLEGVFKKSNSGTSFREGDTLFAKITPCLENGKTAFVLDLKSETVARGSTEFIVMRAKEKGSPYLNYCICRDNNFRNYAIQSMTGTSGRQRVPIDRLKTYEIQYSMENIYKFNKAIKPIFKKIKNNTSQIQTLSKTRDTLLPKLMSGEIRAEGFKQ